MLWWADAELESLALGTGVSDSGSASVKVRGVRARSAAVVGRGDREGWVGVGLVSR